MARFLTKRELDVLESMQERLSKMMERFDGDNDVEMHYGTIYGNLSCISVYIDILFEEVKIREKNK